MALRFGARRTTQDVDAVLPSEGRDRVLSAADRIADACGLPRGWLNTKAADAGYVPPAALHTAEVAFREGSLEVSVPSREHMIAMKLCAYRGATDRQDLEALLAATAMVDVESVWDAVGGLVPSEKRGQARYHLELFWEAMHEPS
jgi:hypothetical protein